MITLFPGIYNGIKRFGNSPQVQKTERVIIITISKFVDSTNYKMTKA